MTLARIEKLREVCTQKYCYLDGKALFSLNLNDWDIDGGLNFEEEINYYIVGDTCWLCRHVIEKTIQPASGTAITIDRDEHTTCITNKELLDILNENAAALKDFEAYESTVIDKFYNNM